MLAGITCLVRDMEEMGHMLILNRPEYKDVMTTNKLLNFPSAGGNLKKNIATKFALGENYLSQVPFDHNKFLCLLSFLP